jgi:hypothetical protein
MNLPWLDSRLARRGAIARIARTALGVTAVDAFLADPSHGTVGRTAKERLDRAITRARAADLTTPALDAIAASSPAT